MPQKRFRRAFVPLAVVALTGAMATAPALAKPKPRGGGSGQPGSTLTAPAFSTATVVGGQDAGEPGIDVSPTDGAIYINAPSALGNVGTPSYVWKSTDQG